MLFENIIETIGNTPLVRLNRVTKDLPCPVYAKVESFNPGNSIKDRIALTMIQDAEMLGTLKRGGTIIEGTSGNTGMGLALVAIAKGYKCIFTTTDKQSKEKMDILRAVGAEVIVCPTNVEADDPRSYYSVARRLSREIPNSIYPNQYDNLANTKAHYDTTGPEIWEQTKGKVTHLVAGCGTGGTISGTGKFLKEKNPAIQNWAIDTYGSVLKKFHDTGEFDEKEIYPYITEGIGEDIIPKNVDFKVIDYFEKVSDKDAALMARDITRKEGIFVGYSTGSVVAGLIQLKDKLKSTDLVVVIFPDHGSRYIAKIFNDNWMRERGWLEVKTVRDILSYKTATELISVSAKSSIGEAIMLMKQHDIQQLPVMEGFYPVGIITESNIFDHLLENPDVPKQLVSEIMEAAPPTVSPDMPIERLSGMITREVPAVMSKDEMNYFHIITKYDIIQALAK